VNNALKSPTTATRAQLVAAGNGGTWLAAILEEIDFQLDNGWFQVGDSQIASASVRSVKLAATQPEVLLVTCIDSTSVSYKFQKTGKPVPIAGDDGDRHKVQAQLVLVPTSGESRKDWTLMVEKDLGKC
jgi:hypothetical protein